MSYKPYMNVVQGRWALDKGAGMIELNLLDTLVEELTKLFKDYELKAKSGLQQNIKVFAQHLPQPQEFEVIANSDEDLPELEESVEPQGYSEADIEAFFPCILVVLDGTEIKEEGTTDAYKIRVNFLIGTYDNNKNLQGYRDVLDIIEKIRQYILTMPNRILGARYQLRMPMSSNLTDEDTFPFYFGQIETVWETARPVMSF